MRIETCVASTGCSSVVVMDNEAYGTTKLAQPIEIHGNGAYQTAAEAIATEQNGRVEEIDPTDEEPLNLEHEYDYCNIAM